MNAKLMVAGGKLVVDVKRESEITNYFFYKVLARELKKHETHPTYQNTKV